MHKHVLFFSLIVAGSLSSLAQSSDTTTFLLHKFAQNIGRETYTVRKTDAGMEYDIAFKFTDRGTPVPLSAKLVVSSSFEPKSLFIKGNTSRFSTINDTVRIQDGKAWIKVGDSAYE